MRVLVTGAAGFIGSHLAEQLSARGHTVVGLDGLTPYYDPALKQARLVQLEEQGIATRQLDLAVDPIRPALREIDVVYHLAAQPGLSSQTSRRTFVRNNVRATERLLTALADHSTLSTLFYISSSSVYGADATGREHTSLAPISAYGRTKLRAEQAVRAAARRASWEACILRLFSVYGPRERPDKLIHKALRCARTGDAFPLYEGSAEHRRSFTYVEDVVDGMEAALRRLDRCQGEIINLGAPTTASTQHVLNVVADTVGAPLCIERVPPRDGDQRRTCAQIQKARRLLDFSPTTTLREGIAAEAAWMDEARVH